MNTRSAGSIFDKTKWDLLAATIHKAMQEIMKKTITVIGSIVFSVPVYNWMFL